MIGSAATIFLPINGSDRINKIYKMILEKPILPVLLILSKFYR
jgi:hypothetical protein